MLMRVHFFATQIGDASGGAIYDNYFYTLLVEKYPNTKLYDDKYFIELSQKSDKKLNLIDFNNIYKQYEKEIFDCDYLIMNSRIYTRFIKVNLKKLLSQYPHIRYCVIHHHNNYMTHSGLLYLIHKYLEVKVLKAATKLIIPNQYVIDQLQKTFRLDNIVCLPSSFDKKEYEISSLNNGNILFVGNVERRKGLIYALKAFKEFYQKNNEYKFRIVGKYDERDLYFRKLKKFISKNKLNDAVTFEGRVTNEKLDWFYCHSDLFLFPSLLEGYGWVMIEAMGRGIPVVAFDNSAMPYTVKDGYNGMLIQNKQWKQMSDILFKVLGDNVLLKKLQVGALKTYASVPSLENLNNQINAFINSWE